MQKYFRKNAPDIPNLTGPNGIASNDEQKANLIANTLIDNYTENKRPGKHTTNIDSDIWDGGFHKIQFPKDPPTSSLASSASPPMSPHQSSCSNHTAKESTAPREPQRTLKTLYYFTQDSKRTHD
ncbi:hypothetical protein TNCV_176901 [Trichonephila clavipes]|nr:hypothetical protein TNCV_176901 [Trichonephila clavipes]